MYCTDHWPGPADLVLTTHAQADAALITITLRATQADKGFTAEANYRRIEWSDLQAMAAAEGVAIARKGQSVQLRLPWAAPPASA